MAPAEPRTGIPESTVKKIAYKATLSLLLDVVLPIAAWMGGYRRRGKKLA